VSEATQGESVVFRAVSFDIPEGDGRTLHVRIVPYDTPATVTDPPYFTPYQEAWHSDAFEAQLRAIGTPGERKVLLNWEHEPGISNVIGEAVGLESRPGDGLYGVFRILEGQDGDKALQLVKSKTVTHVSLEANATRSERRDGIVWRIAAKLKNVALARAGIAAFPQAQVLAVRTEEEPEPEPEPAPEPDEPESEKHIDEVLARIGVEPMIKRAVVSRPWDGSAARFEDDEYERSCLVCRTGDGTVKERCSLPVLEPNGDLNTNGMHAAASRLNQTSLSPQLKAQAARKLMRYYRQAGETPPSMLTAMAGR